MRLAVKLNNKLMNLKEILDVPIFISLDKDEELSCINL